jgi:hypothetical protein
VGHTQTPIFQPFLLDLDRHTGVGRQTEAGTHLSQDIPVRVYKHTVQGKIVRLGDTLFFFTALRVPSQSGVAVFKIGLCLVS